MASLATILGSHSQYATLSNTTGGGQLSNNQIVTKQASPLVKSFKNKNPHSEQYSSQCNGNSCAVAPVVSRHDYHNIVNLQLSEANCQKIVHYPLSIVYWQKIVHCPLSIVHYPLSIVTALLILCCLLFGGKAWGQELSEYTVTKSSATYTSIASTTNLLSSVSGDAGTQTVSLPFAFPFGETTFASGTNVTVRADGYLYFGTSAPGHTCSGAWTSSSYQLIAPFLNYDGKITPSGTTSGAYSTTQTIGGVQTLVIEFKSLQCYYGDNGNYNFQVRLHANGNISVAYNTSTLTTYSSATHNFFLTNGTDKICLTGSYASPTAGTPSSLPNFTTAPSAGTVITYVRPVITCPKPTDLTASSITTTSATVSWTEGGSATN